MCSPTKLTPRVREVAVLVNQQLTDREIAARLTLSVWTVQDYVKKARRLTGSRSRLGVALAIERGAA
jgi:DNA-binding CsgD family transcriptional regulator